MVSCLSFKWSLSANACAAIFNVFLWYHDGSAWSAFFCGISAGIMIMISILLMVEMETTLRERMQA